MNAKNPFVIVGYEGPEYFCDRERETKKMVEAIENGRNLTLIAPRRYGKTGLIHHVMHQLSDDYAKIYLDIFSTRNLTEFTRLFANAVVGSLDTPIEKTLSSVARFFTSCRPTITPRDDGRPTFSFDIAPNQVEVTLREAFDYLRAHERPIVIAIDEFQQILEYPETGTEALLRGFIQQIPWVRFVFAGSRHHLMGEMFLSAKHPFYQSTDILSLEVINRAAYAEFAQKWFAQEGLPFEVKLFDQLYDRFDGVTWYVQSILNRLWLLRSGLFEARQIEGIVDELVSDRSMLFRDLYFSQTDAAQSLLKAIAVEGEAREVYSGAFLQRHNLAAASTIRSALTALVNADIVYRTDSGYIVYDRLFGAWLKAQL